MRKILTVITVFVLLCSLVSCQAVFDKIEEITGGVIQFPNEDESDPTPPEEESDDTLPPATEGDGEKDNVTDGDGNNTDGNENKGENNNNNNDGGTPQQPTPPTEDNENEGEIKEPETSDKTDDNVDLPLHVFD